MNRRGVLLAGFSALVLALLIGGRAAASLPVVNVQADRPVASLLPASTILTISVDLNPSPQARQDLAAMGRAFTDQPGWRSLQRIYERHTAPGSSESNCYHDTGISAGDMLRYLGHDTTLAVMRPPDLKGTPAHVLRSLQRSVAVLAPLNAHLTLYQVLFHTPVPALQSAGAYRGIAIFRRKLPACRSVSSSVPETVYIAMVHGYTVIAAGRPALDRVIDVADGHGTPLDLNGNYRRLQSHLPSPALITYYVNPAALHLASLSRLAGTTVPQFTARPTGPTAGALTVSSGSLTFTGLTWNKQRTAPSGPSAGKLAAHIPSTSLALVSIQSFARTLRQLRAQAIQAHLLTPAVRRQVDPILRDVTATMTGEADLVLLKPVDPGGAGSVTDVPAGILWQTIGRQTTFRDLGNAVRRTGLTVQLHSGATPDGTPYRILPGGYGYGVWHNWAVVSGNAPVTIVGLEDVTSNRLAQSPVYRAAFPVRGNVADVVYLNVAGLRSAFESILLPHLKDQAVPYRRFVEPLLAPIQTVAGTTITTDGGKMSVATLRVTIHN